MDSQDCGDPGLPVESLQGLPGCRGRGHGGGMRPLRQTEDEGHPPHSLDVMMMEEWVEDGQG